MGFINYKYLFKNLILEFLNKKIVDVEYSRSKKSLLPNRSFAHLSKAYLSPQIKSFYCKKLSMISNKEFSTEACFEACNYEHPLAWKHRAVTLIETKI